MAISQLIGGWYNICLRHWALNYLWPVQFEKGNKCSAEKANINPSTKVGISSKEKGLGTEISSELSLQGERFIL